MNDLVLTTGTDQRDTFEKVKDALESRSLRKLRMTNISRAFKLQLRENRKVRIVFNTDQGNDREVITPVLEYDQYHVGIANNQFIPVRAIKTVRLKL